MNSKFPGTQGKEKDKERVHKPWRGNGEQDRDRLVESQSTELQRRGRKSKKEMSLRAAAAGPGEEAVETGLQQP